LVLLPGIVGDADVFARQAPLGRQGPVFAVDLPADARLDRVEAIADAIVSVLPPGPLVVVGVSLGALVGRALGAQLGARVRGVVGVGALPHPRYVPRRLRWLAPLLTALPEPVARRAWRYKLEQAMRAEGIGPAEAAQLLRRLPSAAVGRARLRAVLHLRADVGPPPAAWFRGQFEREAPWTVADAARDLPGTPVSTLPGGHRAHWTHAGAFNALVAAWWSTLARTRR
jgi:pimeloyl-ACP methyl ester carboxylesterase